MSRVLLLDMDGTITESRKSLDVKHKPLFLDLFVYLSAHYKIGIVSGSPYDYILEQISELRSVIEYWMPCNGTQLYKTGLHEPLHSVGMKDKIGGNYQKLVSELLQQQSCFMQNGVPVSGHFIQYRGSMLNWCPIGRDPGSLREDFVRFDKTSGFREKTLKVLEPKLTVWGLVCTKGGETSFDIYPKGWDKTYALKHFPGSEVTFIGDSIFVGGNDYTIAMASQKWYSTKGPEETLSILQGLCKEC